MHDPETAPLIEQAFELFATGRYERAEVLRLVTASGLRSKKGRKLSQQSFCNMLKNPFYAGKLVVGRWETDCKAAFQPIISNETYSIVQSILAGRRPTSIVRRHTHPDFPLRHFVSCGVCERPLTGSWSKGRGKTYPYYHCSSSFCKSRNIPKKLLESEFLKLIEQLQPKPEYLRLFSAVVLDVWKQRQSEATKVGTTLQSRVDELKSKRQRVIDAFFARAVHRPINL